MVPWFEFRQTAASARIGAAGVSGKARRKMKRQAKRPARRKMGARSGPGSKVSAAVLLLFATGCSPARSTPAPYSVTIDLTGAIQDLGSDDLDVSEPAAAQIEAAGGAALPALERVLAVEPTGIRVRAVEVVAAIGEPESVPLLIRACSDPEPAVRAEALLGLDTLADERGRPAVEAALNDPDADVRRAAAQACGALCRSPRAFDRLVEMALHEQPAPRMFIPLGSLREALLGEAAETARAAILRGTGPFVDPSADPDSRARAALLLALVGDARAPALLGAAVQTDIDVALGSQAALALGGVGDASAVRALMRALNRDTKIPRPIVCRALNDMAERGVRGARAAHRTCVALSARPKAR